MDLNLIETIIRPTTRAELPAPRDGDAILAGGTWLFSEPQPYVRRLVDLATMRWPAIEITADGVRIAATCTLAELEARAWPAEWAAAALIPACCRALLGSFKIWNMATIGGNLCLALPAAPMVALIAALDGVCVIWNADGHDRHVAATAFVVGAQRTVLAAGEVLREITVTRAALRRRSAFRQVSLTPLGRSATLVIGTIGPAGFALTITASTPRPVRIHFDQVPTDGVLVDRIDAMVMQWHDDVHGAPDWRRHITHLAAREIRDELAAR